MAGFWIDGGRIGSDMMSVTKSNGVVISQNREMAAPNTGRIECDSKMGRWPANLLLDEKSARLLDEQSGELTSGAVTHETDNHGQFYGGGRTPLRTIDHGGASRFFYTSKASSSERNAGLEDVKEVLAGVGALRDGGRQSEPRGNCHPTVKPVDLMRYLCKLTRTPTGGVVLDPFMGSGTTGIAALLEHRDFIGIELSPEYVEIARKRIIDMEGSLFTGGPDEKPLDEEPSYEEEETNVGNENEELF